MGDLVLGTKAQTLSSLQDKLEKAAVLPVRYFTVEEYRDSPQTVLDGITGYFPQGEALIVRSSALSEDSETGSNAGAYLSVSNVIGREALTNAIGRVISAYGSEGDPRDEVLVQPALTGVEMSGVVFTLDPNTGGQYYVINYDDTTGSTSSVTGGNETASLKLLYHFKTAPPPDDGKLAKVIAMAQELEALFAHDSLDIEFALTADGALYLLQARPLVLHKEIAASHNSKELYEETLSRVEQKIKNANLPKPYLSGDVTIFGVMPDWNPAEMIGTHPKPLALSLYKNIITDSVWAYQRSNYGYKNLRSFPLLIDFCGLPYIDVRISFNSFVPKSLDKELADKLVGYYLDRLAANPDMHDKVEFEIVFTCYTLTLPERIQILSGYGFTQSEIETITAALRDLTNNIIRAETGLWVHDTLRADTLKAHHSMVMESDLDTISKIYWLLEDCKRYGTLPFAGLARAGFVAVQMLASLVDTGILSREDSHAFMTTLDSLSKGMAFDSANLSKAAFLRKYGHLRPGTYDICSMRYDEAPDLYLNWDTEGTEPVREDFRLSLDQYTKIQEAMSEHGLSGGVLDLFQFIKSAIEGRELSKFIFTKSLSDALMLVEQLGREHGLSREDMAFVDIEDVQSLYSTSADPDYVLRRSIDAGRAKYALAQGLVMPPLITSPSQIYSFFMPDCRPNFITLKRAVGELKEANAEDNLEGKILLMHGADPGYDWIFTRDIAGFITAYGGANSHMAIRAGELSIPAAIGVGEKMYNELQRASVVEIDAAAKRITIL